MGGPPGEVRGEQPWAAVEFNLLWTCMVLNGETLEEGAVGASLSSAHPVQGSSLVDSSKTRPIAGEFI